MLLSSILGVIGVWVDRHIPLTGCRELGREKETEIIYSDNYIRPLSHVRPLFHVVPFSTSRRRQQGTRRMIRPESLALAVLGLMALGTNGVRPALAAPPPDDPLNTVLGTQTIGPAYQFTGDSKLVETSRVVREMGSGVIKIALDRQYARRGDLPKADPSIRSLKDLAGEASFKEVLGMPFAYYLLWATAFDGPDWRKGPDAAGEGREYREVYDLTCHLLRSYSGSHKTFFLGHWEGDWLLRGSYEEVADVPPRAVEGMVGWLNARQRAVDDARRDTPHRDVRVYHYTEVNRVKDAMKGRASVTNDVLPRARVDFVSYSCYDSQHGGDLARCLDYIESKLPPKAGIPGKRVFIGEYGFPAAGNTPKEQDLRSRRVMRTGLEWGCPFVLYWEVYNNEVKGGEQIGFWLIDDKRVKQPVYHTHRKYFEWAKRFVAEYRGAHGGRAPDLTGFRREAVRFLDSLPNDHQARETKQDAASFVE